MRGGVDLETIQVGFEYNNFMTIKKKRTKKNVFYCNLCLNRSGTFQILCLALNNDVGKFLHTLGSKIRRLGPRN